MKRIIANKIVNLTNHNVRIFNGNKFIDLPSSNQARAETEKLKINEITYNGINIPLYEIRYGEVHNVPAPKEGVFYIVSSTAYQVLKGTRNDLLVVGDVVRDSNTRLINGCKSFTVDVKYGK